MKAKCLTNRVSDQRSHPLKTNHTLYKYSYIHFCRALYLNCIGLLIIITLSASNGLVMYAYYSKCDPYTDGKVQKMDQVNICDERYKEGIVFG